MRKRELSCIFIVILIFLFLIIGLISAQDSGAPPGVTPVGGNPAALPSATDEGGTGAAEAEKLDPKEITQKEPVSVGDYFGYEDPNRVKVQGLAGEGQDQTITVEQLEGDKRKVSGIGDFSVTFYDKEGKETKEYAGLQKGEFDNTWVFDKNNELTDGTKVIGGDSEGKPGTRIPMGNKKHYLPKGGELLINKDPKTGETKTSITASDTDPENNVFKYPEEMDGDRKEVTPLDDDEFTHDDSEKTVEYRARGDTKLIDSNGEKISVKGTMHYKSTSDDGDFYREKGVDLTMGGVEFKDGEGLVGDTRIITKSDNGIPKNYNGPLVGIDKKRGFIGVATNSKESSAILNVAEENGVVPLNMKDEYARLFAMQAKGGEEPSGAFVLRGKEGDEPTLHVSGKDIKIAMDNIGGISKINPRTGKADFFLNTKGSEIISQEDAKGTLTFPMKIVYNSEGGENPFAIDGKETSMIGKGGKELDLHVNGFRQFATVPKDIDWEEQGGIFKTSGGFSISPRMKYNYLSPEEQGVVNQVIEGNEKFDLKLFEDKGFFEMTPGKQQEFFKEYGKIETSPPITEKEMGVIDYLP